jgi:hypothetical protein
MYRPLIVGISHQSSMHTRINPFDIIFFTLSSIEDKPTKQDPNHPTTPPRLANTQRTKHRKKGATFSMNDTISIAVQTVDDNQANHEMKPNPAKHQIVSYSLYDEELDAPSLSMTHHEASFGKEQTDTHQESDVFFPRQPICEMKGIQDAWKKNTTHHQVQ